jgi:hypothetical protein
MDAQLHLTPRICVRERHVDGTYKSSGTSSTSSADGTKKGVKRLLLREKADLPNERRSLFICAECGDLGCGAITLEVHNENGKISWSNFGYENTCEDRVQFD